MSVVKLLYPERYPAYEGEFDEVVEIEIDGEGLAACETAFAIFNSYPDGMHCDRKYLRLVEEFRNLNRRSMSVGDRLDVDGVLYECASMGFVKVAS